MNEGKGAEPPKLNHARGCEEMMIQVIMSVHNNNNPSSHDITINCKD